MDDTLNDIKKHINLKSLISVHDKNAQSLKGRGLGDK